MKVQPHLETYTLKPTVIPENFVLLQDTREQRALFNRIPKGLTIQSCTLSNGDYRICLPLSVNLLAIFTLTVVQNGNAPLKR